MTSAVFFRIRDKKISVKSFCEIRGPDFVYVK